MFAAAEAELAARGMALHDVARTWIHLADIGRDYAALNRVRRDLFVRRGISPPPASTGIGGSPLLPVAGAPASSRSARCSLALHAVSFTGGARFTPLRSPSLNEAPLYGSDFSRGMRLPIPGGELLHISGTAAVDERGLTVAPGDLRAQVERTLLNVRLLLEGAGAGLGDVVAAVTYLKDRSALDSCLALLEPLGLLEAPHAIVEAEICRPELLIEVEAIAVR
jgi:enamine deaminase RidA (YjgF/YER057c/UK114 family)